MKTLMRFALFTALVGSVAFAQVPQTTPADTKAEPRSKVERKNRAPVSKEVLRVKLPKPMKVTLDNGLKLLVLEDHRFPIVNLQLQLHGAGPLYEPADMPGLANVTATMMREGTKTLSSRELSEKVDSLGVVINSSSGFGSPAAVVFASGLSDNMDQWLPLVGDILLNPAFSADELNKLKQRMKVQLRQQRAQPGFLANERFSRVVMRDHPAAVISATEKSVDAMTPELLTGWYRERYVPQNAILAIVGDINADAVISKVKELFGKWQKTSLTEVLPANPTPLGAKKVYVVNRPESVQTTVVMGNVGIDRRSPDYIPFVVLNTVLGGGAGARLFINLREEKGYTYGAYSQFTAVKFPGPWRVGGDVRTEVTEGAMTEFLKELKRIREERVPTAELEERKRSEVAVFALSLEQPTQLINYAITREIYGLPDDYWDTYPAKVMAVTAEDVQRVAQKYMDPETMQMVAVGDATKVRTILERYGPIELYDTEGNLVPPS